MKRNRNARFEMPLEVEVGSRSVEYVVAFDVSPGEPERGPTYSCAGEPGCGPEVESFAVFYERKGKDGKIVREPRPELEALVDEDDLPEHAAMSADDDGPDPGDEADRRREMRAKRWEGSR